MTDFNFDTESKGYSTKEANWFSYTSPVGEAIFPHFNVARPYTDRATGVVREGSEAFDGNLRVGGADAQAFAELIETFLQESGEKHNTRRPNGYPVIDSVDKDKQAIDGYQDFKFKVSEKLIRKDGTEWYRKPVFYDHNGEVYPEDKEPQIGMGSILRINYQVNRYKSASNVGVQLQPTEIQVLKLVEYTGGGSGAGKGFGAEDPKDFGGSGTVPPGGDDADESNARDQRLASGQGRRGDF